MLGIPTVVDRLVQQAILQVLQRRFDRTFSESSYGFRPARRAHDAVRAAQKYIQSGKDWVVDVDLEKFFDCVNHDVLMGRLEKRIADKRLLAVIRRFLKAGMMADGAVIERSKGTPQRGPLSPLLANVLLDEVDKELERRGFSFARYADDCNVYVSSQRVGEDVMKLLRRLFEGLRLKINEAKSGVARPWERKFLEYSFWVNRKQQVQPNAAPKSIEKPKDKVREFTGRTKGRFIKHVVEEMSVYLRGWKAYFQLAATPRVFERLDGWIRRRLRALQLKQWGGGRTAYRELQKLGATKKTAAKIAAYTRRWWHNSDQDINNILSIKYFDRLGLARLA